MMRFDKFTERAQDAAMRAYEILQRYQHSQADTEHLFLALLEQPKGLPSEILEKASINPGMIIDRLNQVLSAQPKVAGVANMAVGQVYITPRLKRVLDNAQEEAKTMQDDYISTEHLFLAICSERGTPAARILQETGMSKSRMIDAIKEIRAGQKATSPLAETSYRTLEKYSLDLTALAIQGKLDPVIGRDKEILRLIRILSRRTKNNPVIIGEAGVGKTAIVEGLAQKITDGDVPEILLGRRIVSLDLGAMIAGSRFRGEFEERLKSALEEIRLNRDEIILFIDELHTVVGAGAAQGAVDASNMMKPALARGELHCVGATTLDEYRKYIEKDPTLERRFAPVLVEEPTVEQTIEMLRGLKHRYEAHHHVTYTDEALIAAAQLSHRYVTDRHLPDKAIDLIDEAASKLRVDIYSVPEDLKDKKKRLTKLQSDEDEAGQRQDWEHAARIKIERLTLGEAFQQELAAWRQEKNLDEVVEMSDIAEVVSMWTGIPVHHLALEEKERLLRLETAIRQRIIGQNEAIIQITRVIKRAKLGLADPHRPLGVFLFAGPTGVGKTEAALVLTEALFDNEEAILRLDMSEFMEKHQVARLTGAPPGYIGYEEAGQLTEHLRYRPYSVVLLDEMEKAHREVQHLFLQLFDTGRLTDGQGRMINGRNAIFIMTTNLGAREALAFSSVPHSYQEQLRTAIYNHFTLEFINRIDRIIYFAPLNEEALLAIFDHEFAPFQNRLRTEQGIEITVTLSLKRQIAQWVAKQALGARPMRRFIEDQIISLVIEGLFSGEYKPNTQVTIDQGSDLGLTQSLMSIDPIEPVGSGLGTE